MTRLTITTDVSVAQTKAENLKNSTTPLIRATNTLQSGKVLCTLYMATRDALGTQLQSHFVF